MGRVIVIQFISIDGVVEDPDGSKGTPTGGWAMRFGPLAIGGDKFRLGSMMETGSLLFGRRTWDLFSQLWPTRSGGFADAMNSADKLVVSRSPQDLSAWSNSRPLDGQLSEGVAREAASRDVVVIGSTSVTHALTDAGLVDEYRLLVFPVALGAGDRLFTGHLELELAAVEQTGAMTLMSYVRPA